MAKAILIALVIAGGYAAYKYKAKVVSAVGALGAGIKAVITKKIP